MQSLQNTPEMKFIGMNNREKPELLKKGYVVTAKNCLLGDGEIVKGPGTVEALSLGPEESSLGGISTNTEIYVVFDNAESTAAIVYRWTGSGEAVPVASLTASTQVNFVEAGEAVYVFNGTDAVVKLVGAVATTPAGIPVAKFGYWINNRMYVAGVSGNEARIYFSDANDPDTFGGSSNIDIFKSQRGAINSLGGLAGLLIVGKKDNIISFNGYTSDDFTVKSLTEQIPNTGIASQRSVVNVGNDMYYLSFSGDVPHIRSLKRTAFGDINDGGIISGDIEETMKDINKDQLEKVAGGYDGRYCWWSVPTGSSTENDTTICYDTLVNGWTIHDGMSANVYFRSAISGRDRLYYGANSDSKLFYLDRTRADRAGNDLSWELISRVYRPSVSQKSKFKYLYTVTGADTQQPITVESSPDNFTYETQDIISPNISGSVFPMTFPLHFGASADKRNRTNIASIQAYTLQLKFSESSTQQVIIKEWDLYHYTRGLRSTT